MKILNTKPTISKEHLVYIFEKIHVEKAGSTVKKYIRVGFNDDNSLNINQSNTNITDGNCTVIFGTGALYTFINTILPEEEAVTHHNLSVIDSYSRLSREVAVRYEQFGYRLFMDKLLGGEFQGNLLLEEDMLHQITVANFDYVKSFYLELEDSSQNVFSTTNPNNLNNISQTSSSAISTPMNDSDTTVKDGFNADDVIKVFLTNTFYNTKIELICQGNPNMKAADQKQISIESITTSDEDIRKYNTLLANL